MSLDVGGIEGPTALSSTRTMAWRPVDCSLYLLRASKTFAGHVDQSKLSPIVGRQPVRNLRTPAFRSAGASVR